MGRRGRRRAEPTDEELAQRLGWKLEQVREAKEAIPDATTSLNGPLGSGADALELWEFIEDERRRTRPAR